MPIQASENVPNFTCRIVSRLSKGKEGVGKSISNHFESTMRRSPCDVSLLFAANRRTLCGVSLFRILLAELFVFFYPTTREQIFAVAAGFLLNHHLVFVIIKIIKYFTHAKYCLPARLGHSFCLFSYWTSVDVLLVHHGTLTRRLQ